MKSKKSNENIHVLNIPFYENREVRQTAIEKFGYEKCMDFYRNCVRRAIKHAKKHNQTLIAFGDTEKFLNQLYPKK